jgi:hypothetical protein
MLNLYQKYKAFETRQKQLYWLLALVFMMTCVACKPISPHERFTMINAKADHYSLKLTDGRVILCGGEGSSNTIEIYEPYTKKFRVVYRSNTPLELNSKPIITKEDIILFNVSNKLLIYEPEKENISAIENIPFNVASIGLVNNDTVFLLGQSQAGIYNLKSREYNNINNFPLKSGDYKQLVLKNGKILLWSDKGNEEVSTWIYNLNNRTCTPLKNINITTDQALLLKDGNVLLIAPQFLSQLNIAQSKIERMINLPGEIIPETFLIDNNQVLLIGTHPIKGYIPETDIDNAILLVDLITGKIIKKSILKHPRYGYKLLFTDSNKLIFIGGEESQAMLPVCSSKYIEIYDANNDMHLTEVKMKEARHYPGAVMLNNRELLITGGRNECGLFGLFKSSDPVYLKSAEIIQLK